MGALTLPASGLVYIDTMTLIYTDQKGAIQGLWRRKL